MYEEMQNLFMKFTADPLFQITDKSVRHSLHTFGAPDLSFCLFQHWQQVAYHYIKY